MDNFKYSVFCLDFRNFKSAKELDSFFKEVGLDMIGSSWYDAHLGNWIKGVVVNKVWIDSVTLSLVAYETDKEQMIYPSFAQFLNNSKGIDKTFQYGSLKFNSRKDLTLDDILDKILVSGTSSLTDFEKSFLEQQSNQI
jgi:hypothetical protein